jgi:hypothetical protein
VPQVPRNLEGKGFGCVKNSPVIQTAKNKLDDIHTGGFNIVLQVHSRPAFTLETEDFSFGFLCRYEFGGKQVSDGEEACDSNDDSKALMHGQYA